MDRDREESVLLRSRNIFKVKPSTLFPNKHCKYVITMSLDAETEKEAHRFLVVLLPVQTGVELSNSEVLLELTILYFFTNNGNLD